MAEITEFVSYWAGHIFQHVPIVTWVGLVMTIALLVMWFTKRWAVTPVLALCCVLYAVTPYLPVAGNTLPGH